MSANRAILEKHAHRALVEALRCGANSLQYEWSLTTDGRSPNADLLRRIARNLTPEQAELLSKP